VNDFRLAHPGPVVVTGSAGRLGRAVTAHLLGLGVQIRAFDRNPTPGVDPRGGSSLLDSAALDRVMAGAGTLIHLAATPQDEDFDSELVPNNVVGLQRVMRSAARAGVRRWILASSIQVNLRQSREGPWPVRVTDPISPLRWYAATKVLLESAGYSHARDQGIEVLAVRLGWCPRDAGQVREIEEEAIAQDTFLSPGDTGRFFAAAASRAMAPGFRVVFATSRPVREWVFDPEPARTLLGWEPLDVWPMDAVECRS
jgi:dTDP-4-dehydrorhamnose reductase